MTTPASYEIPETIAAGASVSGDIAVGGKTIVGIYTPAVWTAADLTFQVSRDGTNWSSVRDAEGTELTLTGWTAGDYILIPPGVFNGVDHIRLRSGTSGTPVNQGADRAFYIVTRAFE